MVAFDHFLIRSIDILLAVVLIGLLAPVLLTVSILLWVTQGRPIIYAGERGGLFGRPFKCFKFRTMAGDGRIGATSTSDFDPRITSVGRVLRSSKLDELPQLFNVLVGKMSFVGPRPNTFRNGINNYTSDQMQLLTVRPGITDLASIFLHDEGMILRDNCDPDEFYNQHIWPIKFLLARVWVKNRSLKLYLEVLFATALLFASRSTAFSFSRSFLITLADPGAARLAVLATRPLGVSPMRFIDGFNQSRKSTK